MTTDAFTPPAGATLHLGGDCWAFPDLAANVRPLRDDKGELVIRRHPKNPRRGDHETIVESIRVNGVYRSVTVQQSTGYVLAGNHTYDAALDQGAEQLPWTWLDVDDDHARRIMLVDNAAAERGDYDQDLLLEQVRAAKAADTLLAGTAFNDQLLAELEAAAAAAEYTPPVVAPTLSDRFVIPPFTILDARAGAWQDRKRRWLALGIQSEVGRDETLAGLRSATESQAGVPQGSTQPGRFKERTLAQGLQAHRGPTGDLVYEPMESTAGVSIFDPVLCELAYRWFSPPTGHVLDPFAGGSVRGIVAAALGRSYTGVELRAEQVDANQAQLPIIDRLTNPEGVATPLWVTGDSRQVLTTLTDPPADLVFSCPPYADLEVYSDDPADLSNMAYDDFLTAYQQIITATCDRLRPDRFAVWVIGEVRDKRGLYRGLVPDTIRAFTNAGLALYNEAILVTPVGSLPIRAGRQFAAGRKLGKTHQNVLVFCKGDPRAAADACGIVDVTMPDTDAQLTP